MHVVPTPAARARVAILIVVGALCVVPALVRATYSFSTTSPLRLNRGFERPPSKATVAPPAQAVVLPLLDTDTGSAAPEHWPAPVDIVTLRSFFETPPDALRGPPAPAHA
jgi:hypothetical protein